MKPPYIEIVQRRRALRVNGFRTLADVGFDGPWVTPYQIGSCSAEGPVLLGLHWLDEKGINENRVELERTGYLSGMSFNIVLDMALRMLSLNRADIYVTQAFHLIPPSRSYKPNQIDIDRSFSEVTHYELIDRKVIALGTAAATACRRHGVDAISVTHPAARGVSFVSKAARIAATIRALGFGLER